MNLLAAIVVVTNIGFTAGFDTERCQPAWVEYDLEPSEVVATNRAPVEFRADPRIVGTDFSAVYKSVARSFDRGHLAPAADFNWSKDALKETYYFSNVCPMDRAVNRGKWAKVEAEVRALAASGTVHVVTFPRFSAITLTVDSGTGRTMPIPDSFVKIARGWFGVRMWEVENWHGD